MRPLFDDDPRLGLPLDEPPAGPAPDTTVSEWEIRVPDPTGEPIYGRPGDPLEGSDPTGNPPFRLPNESRLDPKASSFSEGADGGA